MKQFYIFILSIVLSLLIFYVQAGENDEELIFQSDQVEYDQKNNIVIASGNVKLYYFGRTILANRVEYDEKTEFVKAFGDITIIEPDGNTAFFAEELELNKDFSDGFIDAVKVYKKPHVRIASQRADIKNEDIIVLKNSVYSACKLCPTNPNKAPLWQIKSKKTIENRKTKNMTHLNNIVEMGGIPVMYLPFASHPDPTVKQRTGFLAPTYYSNKEVGSALTIPFYIALSENYDFTARVTPTEKQNVLLGGEWRHQLENGYYEIDGAYVAAKRYDGQGNNKRSLGDKNRYHIFANGDYDINDYFRAGFDINKISDADYLDTFRFSSSHELFNEKNIITSEAYLEGFDGRDYISTKAYSFDDIRQSSARGNAPIIAPFINMNLIGDADSFLEGRLSLDTSFVSLERDNRFMNIDDQDMQRFIADLGWQRIIVNDLGFVNTFELHGIARQYNVDHYQDPRTTPAIGAKPIILGPQQGQHKKFSAFNSQGMYNVSYPWFASYGFGDYGFSHTIEPLAAVIFNNNSGKQSFIPNEDSVDLELDSANLFSLNMNPGMDRFDQGTRVAYGLKNSFYGYNSGYMDVFFGQTKRFHERQLSNAGTGLNKKTSDVIGFVELHPHSWFDGSYYFRNDSHKLKRRYFKATADAGPKIFRPGMTYLFNNQPLTANLVDQRRQVTYRVSSQFMDNWAFKFENIRNLASPNKGSRTTKGTLIYEDECFIFETHAARMYTRRNSIEPQDEIYARIVLKTVMEVQSPSYKGSSSNQKRLKNNGI